MRKLGLALYTIFALLFAGLPFFVLKMSSLGTAQYETFTLWPCLGFALGAIVLCLVPKEFPALPDWLAGPLWGCAAFQYRYHCFHLVEPHMVMKYDFGAVLDSVRGTKLVKEAIFTHWAFYPRVLEFWNKHWGSTDFLYRSAVYFNLMVGGLLVLLVYLIARRIWRRQRVAHLAAAALCFWPSFSYYASVTSNEHLAMFFMLLATYLGILAWQIEGNRRWALTALTGLCIGLADLFKQFSPVFLIASFGAGLVFLLIGEQGDSPAASPRKGLGKRILCLLLAVVLMFGVSYGVKEKAYRWLESYLEMPVCRGATAHFLWIGLKSRGGGVWTEPEGYKVYELAEQYDYDYDKVMGGLWDLLREDLKQHPDSLKGTLQNKMETDWQADIGVSLWIKSLYDEIAIWEEESGEEFHDWSVSREELDALDFDPGNAITVRSAAWYVCVMGLVALGGLLAFARRDPAEMYLRLVFYGYALLFLLSEAQGRYQIVLFPFFALLAAGAAERVGALPWESKQARERKHRKPQKLELDR